MPPDDAGVMLAEASMGDFSRGGHKILDAANLLQLPGLAQTGGDHHGINSIATLVLRHLGDGLEDGEMLRMVKVPLLQHHHGLLYSGPLDHATTKHGSLRVRVVCRTSRFRHWAVLSNGWLQDLGYAVLISVQE